jgi:hypothetical protein
MKAAQQDVALLIEFEPFAPIAVLFAILGIHSQLEMYFKISAVKWVSVAPVTTNGEPNLVALTLR